MRFPQPVSRMSLYRGPLGLAIVVALLPLFVRGEYVYLLPLAQLCGIYAIAVSGLTLLMGFAGQVSLGQAGFYAAGAYVAAVLAQVYHYPIWLAMVAGVVASGIVAFVIGYSLLRLKGHHLALATLCVGVIIHQFVNRLEITGGAAGLFDLPELRADWLSVETGVSRFYIIWAFVLAVIGWMSHLSESPAGRAMRAVHGDEEASQALGINPFMVKLKVFTACGLLAGLAGCLYAFVYTPSYLGPEDFGLMLSVAFLTMAVIGGLGSIWGGITGAAIFLGMREAISLTGEKFGSTDASRYEMLVFGMLLIGVMIFSRDGLIPGLRRFGARLVSRRRILN